MNYALILVFLGQLGSVFDDPAIRPEGPEAPKSLSIDFLAQASESDGRIYIKAYSGKYCTRCKEADALVGTGDNRVFIDWTEEDIPKAIEQRLARGYQFPVYVVETEDGKYSWPQQSGMYDRTTLYNMFSTQKPVKHAKYMADGAGGVIHGQAYVDMMFDWLEKEIGEDVEITIRWDKTGAQTFPLKAGADWSQKAVLGRMGEFSLRADKAKNLFFREISAEYRHLNDDTDDLALKPTIIIRGLGKNLVGSDGRLEKLDPITISTIFSVVSIIYQMLNPKIDLQLPGSLETKIVAKNRQLDITFTKGPSVHVSAWFQFDLAVQKITVVRDKAVMYFTGSNWIKSREMAIVP